MASRTFTFLGTGTSVGVPMIGCQCEVCQSADPHNQRYRSSVMLRVPQGFSASVLWPEFTQLNQALRTYLNEVTLRVIHQEIHSDASEAQEVPDALLPPN